MEQEIQRLKDAVEAQTTVVGSAVTLMNDLGAKVKAAADDPAQVRAIADQIVQRSQELAAAVAANTTAEGESGGSGGAGGTTPPAGGTRRR